jgi:penicillin-binding protein 1A
MVGFIRFLFVCVVILAIAGCGFAGLTIWYFGRDLPDYQQLAHYEPPIMTRVQAGDGRLLAEYASERRVFVPIAAIPRTVSDAFIAAEDKNFYTHHGIDPVSIIRAALTNIGRLQAHRRPVGASTITQQVAKNMLLTNAVTIQRKIKEILLATRIEAALPKSRILELYLNEIYLGHGAYGVAEAALTYFDKSLDDLSLAEAAFLAELPKAPSRYDPVRFPLAAKARRDWVLDRMVEDGYATPQQAEAAKAEPITLRHREATEQVSAPYFAEEVRRELLTRYGEKTLYQGGLSVRTSLGPRLQAAADKALRDGLIRYDKSHSGWRGAIARIDPSGSWAARLAAVPLPPVAGDVGWRLAMVLRDAADGATIGFADGKTGYIPFSDMRWARRWHENGTFGPLPRSAADVIEPGDVVMVAPAEAPPPAPPGKGAPAKGAPLPKAAAPAAPTLDAYTLCQVPEVSGALVAMDPNTGRVLAISGGFSFTASQFDRATQAMRQEGSAIKPFVYLTALDNGFTPSTLVLDGPIALDQGPGMPKWEPHNYETDDKYAGPETVRVGIEHSINVMSARTTAIIGLDAVAQTIERFGIADHVPREYSISLGAAETTPLRLTTAYAMLVNGGKRITPSFIDRIQDRNGKTIYRADNRSCPECDNVEWQHQPMPIIPDTREQLDDPRSIYQMVGMLQGVIQYGTGHAIAVVGKPLAGKTGTTSDFRDAWFEGFSPDLAAGVYVGFDDPDTLGRGEQAAVVAAPIFRDFMQVALADAPATPFRIPPGIRLFRVDPTTGLPASGGSAIWEAFKVGTDPMTNRDLGLKPLPGEAATPVASAGEGDGATPAPVPAHDAPRSGTGGLY